MIMTDENIVVKNRGFVAKFDVQYKYNGKEITKESQHFSAGISKDITIPDGATDIVVKLKEEYAIGEWSTVLTDTFDQPTKNVMKCGVLHWMPMQNLLTAHPNILFVKFK